MTVTLSRHCSRCGKPLDDAASREAGTGPVCRKLDNALLARLIPADVAKAIAIAQHMVDAADAITAAEETRETFLRVLDDLADASRTDWRTTVKRIEWLASFDIGSHGERERLFGIVEALGYLALTAAWRGETASGKALVWLQDGRTWDYGRPQTQEGSFLFAQGVRNPAFNAAIKRCVGAKFHRAGPHGKPCWSVPVAAHEGFWRAVAVHYPNHEVDGHDDLDALVARAASLATAMVAKPAPVAAAYSITHAGDWLLVRTPRRDDAFLSTLKSLPYSDRKWTEGLRAWMVLAKHETFVRDACERCFAARASDIAA